MGMSASQARYLGLIARQNDLEYQGQQINQERTILSQQVTDLYNTLQNLIVPTPPSTSDYTKVEYTGTIGATTYTFDASSVKPDANGTYTLTLGESMFGGTLTQNSGYSTVNGKAGGTLTGISVNAASYVYREDTTEITKVSTGEYKVGATGKTGFVDATEEAKSQPAALLEAAYFVNIGGTLKAATEDNIKAAGDNVKYYRKANNGETASLKADEQFKDVENKQDKGSPILINPNAISDFYVMDGGTYRKAKTTDFESATSSSGSKLKLKEGVKYFLTNNGGSETVQLSGAAEASVGGGNSMTLENARKNGQITEAQYNGYVEAINNSGVTKSDGTACTPDEFYIIINGNEVSFALISDVDDGNDNAITYSYTPNGKVTKNTTYNNCELTFDASNGRITSISIPNYNEKGELISKTKMDVAAKQVTDELAYKDAYNKYEYDKFLYDKEQQKINAKTEVIQQQDKQLELKLQRLDNERTQITTEIEAVSKVINDNIEASYKTFSG